MNLRSKILICWLGTIALAVCAHFVPALPKILPGLFFLVCRFFIPMWTPRLKSVAIALFLIANLFCLIMMGLAVTKTIGREGILAMAGIGALLGLAFQLVIAWSDVCVFRARGPKPATDEPLS
jgi:hypothetical protein